MQRVKRFLRAALASTLCMVSVAAIPANALAATANASPTTTGQSGRTPFTGAAPTFTSKMSPLIAPSPTVSALQSDNSVKANCPPDTSCQVVLAGLADNGCNWSMANRPHDLPVYGINEHTTEGGLQAALDEAQDTSHCVSWNYLIDQQGNIYSSVPNDSLSYDAANWWVNTHYVEVEHVGYSEDCSTLPPAEYAASIKLDRWLIAKFHIRASSATIAGHDSIPGVNDGAQAAQHWDPGVCWPWASYLAKVGAPIVPTAWPGSPVVTIKTDDSHQPVENCPDANFTGCTPPTQTTTNFVALYTAPSTSAALISDPYLHTDGSAGSDAMQDWGDKAVTGHDYVVVGHKPGWTEIWYGGKAAWFQDNGHVSVPTAAKVVMPKTSVPVAIYGRPMPEYDAPGWSAIPYDHQSQVTLTKYSMLAGQAYPVAAVPTPRTDYSEGCNVASCTGPGDTTVVIGNTKYIEISWNHRYAFVKADDVSVRSL